MVELSFHQEINQELQLMLSPKLLAMLRILALPYVEIITEIEKASEENPLVEIQSNEKLMEYLEYLGSNKKIRKQVDFDEYPGLENIKNTPKKLKAFLLDQLNLIDLDDNKFDIGREIIEEIDDRGYIKNYNEVRDKIVKDFNVSFHVVDEVLKVIQTFEPEGVGARDFKECLLLQVQNFGFESDKLQKLIEKVIKNHLEEISKNNVSKVAEILSISQEGVSQVMDFIKKNLNPNPGLNFGDEAQRVIPSFSIEVTEKGEEVKLVNLEKEYGPKINISEEYQKMLKDSKTDKETVKFLKDKLEKAKELIENLRKRGETSQSIMNIIIEVQKGFFKKGAQMLLPLAQKDLAERLGLHPSTISRALSGKYVQTPKGLVPLSFLCQRELSGFSPMAIKGKIIEIVKNEDKKNPLSDKEILETLKKHFVVVGRRTVASYRKQLGILSADERISL